MKAARLVILGASGDLTGRYVLGALDELVQAELLPPDLDIVGVARNDWDEAKFRRHAWERLERHAGDLPHAVWAEFVSRLSFVQGDVGDAEALHRAVSGAAVPSSST